MLVKKSAWLATAILAAAALAGCGAHFSAPGAIDRTFVVNGPVRLEITNARGDSKVFAGPPGEVRVHADFRVKAWSAVSAHKRVVELSANPPISQEGTLIQIGGSLPASSRLTIDYTIIVPADSQIHATSQSGEIETSGIQGPANFVSTSGKITATAISGDVQARTASGKIQLSAVRGQVEAASESGSVNLADVRGDVRVQTGSGTIQLAEPGGAVVAGSGSGNVNAVGAKDDLRVRTGSGNIVLTGDPQATKYWDIRTSSGNVVLQVPSTASFRFYARTTSGDINAAIPIVMEGTAGRHALRARIGDGKARVEVETTSGSIALH